jgi:hypothetical protein
LTTDYDDERSVYFSGNFNNWVTQDKKFEMERVGHGLYHFKFDPKIKLSFSDIDEPQNTRIYLDAGGDESAMMIDHVKNFKKRLLKKEGYADKMKVRLSINMEGKHNERYWSDEFPKAIEWMYFSDKMNKVR